MIYTNLRFFDRSGTSFEGNLHLGYRHLLEKQELIWGLYAAYDKRKSDHGHWYQQVTLGGELWYQGWFLGANFYLPFGKKAHLLNQQQLQISAQSNNLIRTIAFKHEEHDSACRGGDLEIGVAWTEDLSSHVSIYYFKNLWNQSSMLGRQARLIYEYFPKGSWLGFIENCKTELGIQYDKVRGTTGYLGISLRFGLRNSLTQPRDFRKHMNRLVNRDLNIVLDKGDKEELTFTLEENGRTPRNRTQLTLESPNLNQKLGMLKNYVNHKEKKNPNELHEQQALSSAKSKKNDNLNDTSCGFYETFRDSYDDVGNELPPLIQAIGNLDPDALKYRLAKKKDNPNKTFRYYDDEDFEEYTSLEWLAYNKAEANFNSSNYEVFKEMSNILIKYGPKCPGLDQLCLDTKFDAYLDEEKWERDGAPFRDNGSLHNDKGLCAGYAGLYLCLVANGKGDSFPTRLNNIRDWSFNSPNSSVKSTVKAVTLFHSPKKYYKKPLTQHHVVELCKILFKKSSLVQNGYVPFTDLNSFKQFLDEQLIASKAGTQFLLSLSKIETKFNNFVVHTHRMYLSPKNSTHWLYHDSNQKAGVENYNTKQLTTELEENYLGENGPYNFLAVRIFTNSIQANPKPTRETESTNLTICDGNTTLKKCPDTPYLTALYHSSQSINHDNSLFFKFLKKVRGKGSCFLAPSLVKKLFMQAATYGNNQLIDTIFNNQSIQCYNFKNITHEAVVTADEYQHDTTCSYLLSKKEKIKSWDSPLAEKIMLISESENSRNNANKEDTKDEL